MCYCLMIFCAPNKRYAQTSDERRTIVDLILGVVGWCEGAG